MRMEFTREEERRGEPCLFRRLVREEDGYELKDFEERKAVNVMMPLRRSVDGLMRVVVKHALSS